MVARPSIPLLISLALGLTAPRGASATAIFGAFGQASLVLAGIESNGNGGDIHVESSYQPDREQSGYEGNARVFSLSEGFSDETHVELSSLAFGEALDGSGYSSTGVTGWFDIFNDSASELIAHFTVSWLLEAETAINSGLAHAMGSIIVMNTMSDVPFQDEVDLTASSGSEYRSSELSRDFSMVVPPHEGHFFNVSLVVEGSSATTSSREVPEPVTTSLLVVALLAATTAGVRIRRS